MLVLNYNKPTY